MTTYTTTELPLAADKTQPIVSAATVKLSELADRIHDHLRRFENDPKINKEGDRYFHSGAFRAGRFVGVRYVSYQCQHNLTRLEAIKYLEWLDAGNVGKHWKVIESR